MIAAGESPQRVVSSTALITLISLLALAAPVSAAPAAARDAPTGLGDHVTDCNVSFDAGGNLLLDGRPLSAQQSRFLEAALDGDRFWPRLGAAFDAAVDPAADACVNLDFPSASVVINADATACGAVDATGGTITVGGVELGPELLLTEPSDVLTAAARAAVDACVIVEIGNNYVTADAVATICASGTLLDTGVVNVAIGEDEFFFDGELVDSGGLLEVGVTSIVNIALSTATGLLDDIEIIEVTMVITECSADGAGAGRLSPAATPSPLGLPNTSAWRGGTESAAAALAALLALSLIGLVAARIARAR